MSPADLRAAVAAAALAMCACEGECGAKHRKLSGVRCMQPDEPGLGRPLHAVPRADVPDHIAATLGPADLMAFCPPCARRLADLRARAGRRHLAQVLASSTDALFTLDGAA
jgi:hypothetical protein